MASSNPAVNPLTLSRWKIALILLLFEYLILAFLFDTKTLRELPGSVGIFGYVGIAFSLLLVIATVVLLLGIGKASDRSDSLIVPQQPKKASIFLTIHLFLFILFVVISDIVFNLRSIFSAYPWFWLAAWILAGFSCLLALTASLISFEKLWDYRFRVLALLLSACAVGFVAWIAGRASAELWLPLSQITLVSVKWLLSYFSANITYDLSTAMLGIDNFVVEIDPACSGYESIGLISVFMLAYFWWSRDTLIFPRVFILLPIAIALVWVANVIRISVLIMIGSWISSDLALTGFHSQAGWIFFCAIALGLISLTRYLAFFNKNAIADGNAADAETWNPTAAYLMPLLALLATALVAGSFLIDFNYLYPLPILAGIIALFAYRHYFPALWSWSWQAAAIGVLVFVLWIALEPEPDAAKVTAWVEQLYSLPAWLLGLWLTFRILGSSLLVPIVEELAFRGYLLRRLISADFTEVSFRQFALIPFIVSSLIFGALHQNYLGGVIAGALYAYAQLQRGRLSDAILAHAVTNGLICIYVLSAGRWELWM